MNLVKKIGIIIGFLILIFLFEKNTYAYDKYDSYGFCNDLTITHIGLKTSTMATKSSVINTGFFNKDSSEKNILVQGFCMSENYIYVALVSTNPSNENINEYVVYKNDAQYDYLRIIKIDKKTGEIKSIKKDAVIACGHGNSLSYIPGTGADNGKILIQGSIKRWTS